MDKHKQYIESEYKRLFCKKEPDIKGEEPFYHFVMFGNEGCEGYKVVRKESELDHSVIQNMGLRARFNSHRKIGIYAFKSNVEVPPEKITKSLLNNKSVMRIF